MKYPWVVYLIIIFATSALRAQLIATANLDPPSDSVWLVDTEVMTLKEKDNCALAKLKINKARCGPEDLAGATFEVTSAIPGRVTQLYPPNFEPGLKPSERVIVKVCPDASKKQQWWLSRLLFGRRADVTISPPTLGAFYALREGESDYKKKIELVYAMQRTCKNDPTERAANLKEMAKSQNQYVSFWAIRALAWMDPFANEALFIDFSTRESLSVTARLVIDEALCKARGPRWSKSQERLALLRKSILIAQENSSDVYWLESRLLSSRRSGELAADDYYSLVTELILSTQILDKTRIEILKHSLGIETLVQASKGQMGDGEFYFLIGIIERSKENSIRQVAAEELATHALRREQLQFLRKSSSKNAFRGLDGTLKPIIGNANP